MDAIKESLKRNPKSVPFQKKLSFGEDVRAGIVRSKNGSQAAMPRSMTTTDFVKDADPGALVVETIYDASEKIPDHGDEAVRMRKVLLRYHTAYVEAKYVNMFGKKPLEDAWTNEEDYRADDYFWDGEEDEEDEQKNGKEKKRSETVGSREETAKSSKGKEEEEIGRERYGPDLEDADEGLKVEYMRIRNLISGRRASLANADDTTALSYRRSLIFSSPPGSAPNSPSSRSKSKPKLSLSNANNANDNDNDNEANNNNNSNNNNANGLPSAPNDHSQSSATAAPPERLFGLDLAEWNDKDRGGSSSEVPVNRQGISREASRKGGQISPAVSPPISPPSIHLPLPLPSSGRRSRRTSEAQRDVIIAPFETRAIELLRLLYFVSNGTLPVAYASFRPPRDLCDRVIFAASPFPIIGLLIFPGQVDPNGPIAEIAGVCMLWRLLEADSAASEVYYAVLKNNPQDSAAARRQPPLRHALAKALDIRTKYEAWDCFGQSISSYPAVLSLRIEPDADVMLASFAVK